MSSGPTSDVPLAVGESDVPRGVGEPDGQQRLWTPHRMPYIGGENKPTGPLPQDGCPFCDLPTRPDAEGLLVARGSTVFAVLNLYPYNTGHLLICPFRHVSELDALDDTELAELATFTRSGVRALRDVFAPAGFNLGINLGAVAGAGIAAHLHQHLVPRWRGDANFMPVIARTTVLPEMLADTREKLAAAWPGPGQVQPGRAPGQG